MVSARLIKLAVHSIHLSSSRRKYCVKNFFDSYISLVLVLNHYFIIYIDFSHISASNTALTTRICWSHIEYSVQTYKIIVLFMLKIDEKSYLTDCL